MTKKNKNSDFVAAVVAGLSTLWTSYKQSVRYRHEDPMTSFWNDIFRVPVNDVDAAKYLAEDVAEIRDKLRKKKTDKEFDKIIKNSF